MKKNLLAKRRQEKNRMNESFDGPNESFSQPLASQIIIPDESTENCLPNGSKLQNKKNTNQNSRHSSMLNSTSASNDADQDEDDDETNESIEYSLCSNAKSNKKVLTNTLVDNVAQTSPPASLSTDVELYQVKIEELSTENKQKDKKIKTLESEIKNLRATMIGKKSYSFSKFFLFLYFRNSIR